MEHFKPTNPAPSELMTKSQGRDQGLRVKRGAQPVGFKINQWSHEPYYLYRPEDFEPKRTPTAQQLEILAKGRELRGSKPCMTEGCKGRAWPFVGGGSFCEKCRIIPRVKSAQAWLEADPVILDTEIVELALIDAQGNTLIDTLIKPFDTIPQEVIYIHGIDNEMVANAPTFAEVVPDLLRLAEGRPIVVYNSEYDNRLIKQSAVKNGMPSEELWHLIDSQSQYCLMQLFAGFYGEWNHSRKNYKWKKLGEAAAFFGIDAAGAHRAKADCLMTLGVLQGIAGFEVPEGDAIHPYF